MTMTKRKLGQGGEGCTRSDEETLKKVESASVATAFARYDLPVPGGPYKRMPLHGFLFPAETKHPCRLLHSEHQMHETMLLRTSG